LADYSPCTKPPFGDTDDRIRAIAHGLGLRTIVWSYDTFDWEAGTDNVTDANVDTNYENIIALAQNGTFDTVSPLIYGRLQMDAYGLCVDGNHRLDPRAKQLYNV
jgi:peptidoglycan/xylan/chitin deacetylase (PgdA/CDA1 family)